MRKWKQLTKVMIAVAVVMNMSCIVTWADAYTDVRDYPGLNGSGPSVSSPIEGWYSDDEWEDSDDDYPWAISYSRGWRYSPNGWWYQYEDGTWLSDCWSYIDARWYRFSPGGQIVTGWYVDGAGNRFYLNPVDDGTLGAMRIGWQIIDGKAYYFNTMSDGTLGRLLTNTTTPDGYQVGADGAMLGAG